MAAASDSPAWLDAELRAARADGASELSVERLAVLLRMLCVDHNAAPPHVCVDDADASPIVHWHASGVTVRFLAEAFLVNGNGRVREAPYNSVRRSLLAIFRECGLACDVAATESLVGHSEYTPTDAAPLGRAFILCNPRCPEPPDRAAYSRVVDELVALAPAIFTRLSLEECHLPFGAFVDLFARSDGCLRFARLVVHQHVTVESYPHGA
jgi:hypothetical protein